jgi:hypothetical protein
MLAFPAIRCAECHNKMYGEWTESAHARAATGPLYRKMRDHAGAAGAGCDDCHAPLAKRLRPSDLVVAEGVTCEACHNIKAVEVRRTGAGYDLSLGRVKYGPLCDAKDHYFHRMGCSPLHQEATICAGCHHYYRPLPGGGELPVFTEYDEWNEGPYQARECQSCHMPSTRAEVADGHGVRDGVSHHGWLGSKRDLRARALAASAVVTEVGGKLRIEARVENVGAGHHVPTGCPSAGSSCGRPRSPRGAPGTRPPSTASGGSSSTPPASRRHSTRRCGSPRTSGSLPSSPARSRSSWMRRTPASCGSR